MSGRRAAAALAAVLGLALLAGCAAAPPTPAIDARLSSELSSAVVAVATRASTGDYAGALVLLGDLEARVESAAAQDQITAARLVTLDASLARTRTDLEALALAAATPTVAPSAPVLPDPATVEEPAAPTDTETDNSGNGNENENEKDKGKDKDKEKKDK